MRSKWAFQNFGDYANPIPGSNLYLVITTPGVFHAMFSNMNSEYVQRLNAIGAPLDHCDSGGGSTSGSGQTEQASGSDAGMDSDDDNHSSDSNNGSAALGHSRDGAAEYQGPVCLPRSFIAAVALNAQLHCWPIGTSTGRGQAIEPCGDDYSCTSLNGLAPLCLGRRTALACTVLPCAVSEQRLIRHE